MGAAKTPLKASIKPKAVAENFIIMMVDTTFVSRCCKAVMQESTSDF